jgi:hypothetical protein
LQSGLCDRCEAPGGDPGVTVALGPGAFPDHRRVTAPSARMPIVASPNCAHNTLVTAFELPPGVVR